MNGEIGLVYTGKVIAIESIEGADFIVSATVVCGAGGKWKGVVQKDKAEIGTLCDVYLPDALIPPSEGMEFMEASGWRVKMRRFKGAPSEVLIMPIPYPYCDLRQVGDDMTLFFNVTKYFKPIPIHLQGKMKGVFPSFIPKTDEPNYQNAEGQEGIEKLIGQSYYITEKADGSSTTAYKYQGKFGVCCRNWEIERDENNGYWNVALKYDLENSLPEGIAIQWETCGPGIQRNPMGLSEIDGFLFSAYDIVNKKYLDFSELSGLSKKIKFPMVDIIVIQPEFSEEGIELLGEGTYSNGKPREGVVVRSQENLLGHKPVSFKVINLDYEK